MNTLLGRDEQDIRNNKGGYWEQARRILGTGEQGIKNKMSRILRTGEQDIRNKMIKILGTCSGF
jgi:hypothetical protein